MVQQVCGATDDSLLQGPLQQPPCTRTATSPHSTDKLVPQMMRPKHGAHEAPEQQAPSGHVPNATLPGGAGMQSATAAICPVRGQPLQWAATNYTVQRVPSLPPSHQDLPHYSQHR